MEKTQEKRGLVVGVANNQSIAWGCTEQFARAGASIAMTYLNDKTKNYVEPLANSVNCPIFLPLDVQNEQQMEALFNEIEEKWGQLDFLLHSIAFAPKQDIQGGLIDCSAAGFATAMDISVHSLLRLAKRARPLMKNGGSIITLSFYGAHKVISHYNLMGPVKAALEASVKYLAFELGGEGIRVNALSTGPVRTRAASGLADFDQLMERAAENAPLHQCVTLEQIGAMAQFLVSDNAKHITGQTIYVDAGFNIM